MSKSTYRQTIASARQQIASTSSALSNSRKRIDKGITIINTSKTTVIYSKYHFILSIAFLTNHFVINNIKELKNFLELEATQIPAKNVGNLSYLTP